MDDIKTFFWASSFAHYNGGSDLFEVMAWVRKRDIEVFGVYAPKSRAKRKLVRDYEIDLKVWRMPDPKGAKFKFDPDNGPYGDTEFVACIKY
jgi:hypothetical protein